MTILPFCYALGKKNQEMWCSTVLKPSAIPAWFELLLAQPAPFPPALDPVDFGHHQCLAARARSS